MSTSVCWPTGPGDVIVGDSNFESYRDLATVQKKGLFMVCDINGSRKSTFEGKCRTIEETIETTLIDTDAYPAIVIAKHWSVASDLCIILR